MINKSLKIISINANKSSPPTENALQIAIERGTDILLIQEPWFYCKDSEDWSKEQSTAHPGFTQILPNINQNRRPRTIAYVSKDFTPSTYLAPSSPIDGESETNKLSRLPTKTKSCKSSTSIIKPNPTANQHGHSNAR